MSSSIFKCCQSGLYTLTEGICIGGRCYPLEELWNFYVLAGFWLFLGTGSLRDQIWVLVSYGLVKALIFSVKKTGAVFFSLTFADKINMDLFVVWTLNTFCEFSVLLHVEWDWIIVNAMCGLLNLAEEEREEDFPVYCEYW